MAVLAISAGFAVFAVADLTDRDDRLDSDFEVDADDGCGCEDSDFDCVDCADSADAADFDCEVRDPFDCEDCD